MSVFYLAHSHVFIFSSLHFLPSIFFIIIFLTTRSFIGHVYCTCMLQWLEMYDLISHRCGLITQYDSKILYFSWTPAFLVSFFFCKGDTMRQRIKFTDERVCKSHLLDSCPHDILSGTVSIVSTHTWTHRGELYHIYTQPYNIYSKYSHTHKADRKCMESWDVFELYFIVNGVEMK